MTVFTGWAYRILFRGLMIALLCGGTGLLIAFTTVSVMTHSTPISVDQLKEADGVVVRGGQIDLVGIRRGDSTCPGTTQRYLWRPINIDGVEGVQMIPLAMTVLPAYMPNGPAMITLPVPITVSDGDWFYRAVTQDNCSWLPSWLKNSVRRSPDVSVKVVSPR